MNYEMTMNNWKRGTVPLPCISFHGEAGCRARKGVDEAYRLPPRQQKVEPASEDVPSPAPKPFASLCKQSDARTAPRSEMEPPKPYERLR